jgi:hypothetical protein
MVQRPRFQVRFALGSSLVILAAVAAGCGAESSARPQPEIHTATKANVSPGAPYRDPEGRYQARFFEHPTVETSIDPYANGMQLVTTHVTAMDDAKLQLLTKLELSHAERYDCARAIDGMIQETLDGLECVPTQKVDAVLSGVPGREARFQCRSRPIRGAIRVFCDARDIERGRIVAYSVLGLYKNEAWNETEASAFLESFKLIGAAQ